MDDSVGVRLLIFRVAELACAAEVTSLREILPVQRATRIPGAAPAVLGLVNVRGTLVTLIDGRRVLGRSADVDDSTAERSMVLFRVDDRVIGMTVDEVLDLVTVPGADLTDRARLPGLDPRVVRAVGRRAGQTFVLLDFDNLLAPIHTG